MNKLRPMPGLLLPALFLSVTNIWPLSLLRSFLIVTLSFLFIWINKKQPIRFIPKIPIIFLSFFLIGYFLSAVKNDGFNQNFLIGISGRNQGYFFWITVIILYAFYSTASHSYKEFSTFGLMPLAFLVTIFGTYQWISNGAQKVTLTLGNTNYAGSLLATTTLILLFPEEKLRNRTTRSILIFFLILNVLLGFETETMQYPLLATLGILTALLFKYKNRIFKWEKNKKIFASFFSITLFSCLILLVYVRTIRQPTSLDRLDMFNTAIKIWSNNRLFGVGIENLFKFSSEFRSDRQVRLFGSNVIVDKSHNTILDHFACGGIFVGLPYVLFLLIISLFLLRIFFSVEINTSRASFTIPASLWIIWLAQSMFSTDFSLLTLIGFISAGFITNFYYTNLVQNQKQSKKSTRLKRRVSRNVLLLPFILSVIYYTPILEAYSKVPKILSGTIQDIDDIEGIMNQVSDPLVNEEIASALIENVNNCKYSAIFLNPIYNQNTRSDKFYYWSGLCAASRGENRGALNLVQSALQFYPNNLEYLKTCYQLARDLKDLESADLCFTTLSKIDPTQTLLLNE